MGALICEREKIVSMGCAGDVNNPGEKFKQFCLYAPEIQKEGPRANVVFDTSRALKQTENRKCEKKKCGSDR